MEFCFAISLYFKNLFNCYLGVESFAEPVELFDDTLCRGESVGDLGKPFGVSSSPENMLNPKCREKMAKNFLINGSVSMQFTPFYVT